VNRSTLLVWIAGWAGFALLPWYLGDTLTPALWLGLGGRWWLLPILAPLLIASVGFVRGARDAPAGSWLAAAGILGLAIVFGQGFLIDHRGWTVGTLEAIFGPVAGGQRGMGWGALLTATAFLLLLAHGLALRGYVRGDAFVAGAIALVLGLIVLFVFFPVAEMLRSAVLDDDGRLAPGAFSDKFFDSSIWGLDCLTGNLRCGVAWNTLFLAIFVGAGTTALGLAFALIATRTAFRYKGALRVLSVLPIITPPFVIGLAVILLFGRSGLVSGILYDLFGLPRTRWIYGFAGVALAQLLAFTPIAFLVLIGVVQGIAPSLEEAAQTLRAGRWKTFKTVSLPLMRPGLANAFLLGFVESMADFGNPLVLAGNFEVLSTKIFFAVVGAAHDQGRAAVLAIILLGFTLTAFYAQQQWLGRRSYTTVTGKGDAGLPTPLPNRVKWLCYFVAIPWAIFTFVVYAMIVAGGFVRVMGRDHTPTFEHFVTAFSFDLSGGSLHFTGSAWDSLWTTLAISAVSAPLTAVIGLLTAYLLVRQRFAGQRTFEFGAMLSFAIPGTVIGVSYILAFNVPPIEITGTGLILVICFVFRNMPVGVRAGIATLSQIDKSLDEASLTLGARTLTTMRRVVMPLLRPAMVAALVYSFVRAMTAVSAVIFLVTAEYNMATAYIVGRVEAGEFGLAIAYSSALIVIMLLAILSIQLAVGERRIGRRSTGEPSLAVGAG